MMTTVISSKGQVVIPKPIRTAHHWESGDELIVVEVGDGIFLKNKPIFPQKNLDDVAGMLFNEGSAKTLSEMDKAIRKGVEESFR